MVLVFWVSAIPTIPPRCRYFQMSDPRYQRYPGIFRFRYVTIPARSGIFNSHTIPTIPRYFENSIPYHTGSIRYIHMPSLRYQGYPGILRSRYLPYRPNQVFSEVIPAIPTRTTVWHTPGIYRGNPGKYPGYAIPLSLIHI